MEVCLVQAGSLQALGETLLGAMGLCRTEVTSVTAALMHGSLCGHPGQGQGFDKLPRMWQRIQEGTIVPGAEAEELATGPSWALWEGHNGLGVVVAQAAMGRAMQLARGNGLGCVFVRGSTHLSSAGFHALEAVKEELIGLCLTNAGPELAPWGGITPILGTNPWGMAVPTRGEFPLLLDMALTQSGKGMIRWHQRLGLPIPTNWAYAADGGETDDPQKAMEGPLVPIGEYKGVGLSFMTDVLCGVMTGAAFGQDAYADPARHNVGHLCWALDPAALLPREVFYARLEEFCRQFKSTQKRSGVDEVYLPGELEHQRKQQRLAQGIPSSADAVEGLRTLAEQLGVAFALNIIGRIS